MTERFVGVAIIGAATAALAALRAARRVREDVLLIEAGPFGTTCARVGCMPSKLLIAAAERADAVRTAGTFGIGCSAPVVDGAAVMRRVRAWRDKFVGHVLGSVDSIPASHKLVGRAAFDGDHALDVDTGEGRVRVNFDSAVIATGSRPAIPEPLAGDGVVETTDTLFEWPALPSTAAVFGAGAIGLEIGQALARLGVSVTLFGKAGAVGPLTDPVVLARARAHFCQSMRFLPDVSGERVTGAGAVEHENGGRTVTESFDKVVVATGRRANVDGLRLEATSLARDRRGVPVFDRETGRCGDSAIYIAGDAGADAPILHEASDGGMIAGANAARHPQLTQASRRIALAIVFCDPQVAIVGESHAALVARGASFETGEVDWSDQGRANVMNEAHGLTRVYGETGTGRLLGAEMFGPRAEHLAHRLSLAVSAGMTIPAILEAPVYHPTVEEGVRTALRDLSCNLGMGERPLPHGLDCGPGG